MTGNKSFSIDKEAQVEIINYYDEVIEELDNYTKDMIIELEEICERVKYKKVVDFTNECINFYNEDLKEQIINNLDEWTDSDGSLVAFIRTMSGGEEAEETANRLEDELKDNFESRFANIDELNIFTDEAEISEQDYEELTLVVKDYYKDIENLYDDKRKEIDDRSEENFAFSVISGAVSSTLSGVLSSFEDVSKEIEKDKDEFIKSIEKARKEAIDSSEEISKSAEKKAENLFKSSRKNHDI